MDTFSPSERSSLIRLASALPTGEQTRRAILASLEVVGANNKVQVLNEKGRKVWVNKETLSGPDKGKYKPVTKEEKEKSKKELEHVGSPERGTYLGNALHKFAPIPGAENFSKVVGGDHVTKHESGILESLHHNKVFKDSKRPKKAVDGYRYELADKLYNAGFRATSVAREIKGYGIEKFEDEEGNKVSVQWDKSVGHAYVASSFTPKKGTPHKGPVKP